MATNFEVNIDVNSASLKQLNAEFERLNALAQDVPKNSKEFQKLSQSIQTVGGSLEKTNRQLNGLKIDEKADLAVKAFRGLLGGVQAVSAAFVAFGADSSALEEAEKNLLTIFNVVDGLGDLAQGAVAVQKLLGLSFVETGVAAEGAAVGINAFKSALITTGIGALIVGLGLLVGLLLDTGDEAEAAAKGVDDLRKAFQYNISVLEKESEIISDQYELKRNALNFDKKSAKERSKLKQDELKDQLANNKKQQDALTNYYIIQKKYINKNIEDEKDRAKELEKLNQEVLQKEQALDKKRDELKQAQSLESLRLAQELADEAKQLQEQITQNEIAAINDNNAVKRQLAEKQATSEKQAALIRLNNTKEANREQLAEELKQENLSGTAIANIRDKYRNLNKLAEIQYRKEIAEITFNAEAKLAENTLNTVKETSNRVINELDFVYDEVLANFQDLDTKDIPLTFFSRFRDLLEDTSENAEKFKKSFATKFATTAYNDILIKLKEVNEEQKSFLDTGKKGAEEEAEFLKTKNKEKTTAIFVELEKQELAEVNYYNGAIKRAQERAKTDAEFAKQLPAIEADLIRQREASFDAYQIRKKQVLENGAKNEVQIEENKINKLKNLDKQLLQINRNIEDLKLNQIEDEQQKEESLLKASYDRQIADAESNEELKLALAEEYLVKLAILRRKYDNQEIEDRKALAKQILGLQQQIFNEFSALEATQRQNKLDQELYALNQQTEARIRSAGDDAEAVKRIEKDAAETEEQLRKRAFENEKQRKLALASVNEAAAVLSILAETPKGDFGIATALLIAGAIATAELQKAAIRDTQYIPTYAEGGLVTGLGTGQSDSILARLSNGEFVMNAKSTQRYLPVLTALNESGNSSINQRVDYNNNPPVFKTYVLAGDVTNAQIAEAKINQKRKL